MASIRSALRIRVAAFTPMAPAMVWSSSRSLPARTDRSICCSVAMRLSLDPTRTARGDAAMGRTRLSDLDGYGDPAGASAPETGIVVQ